jgi:hypothetical protein
MPHEDGGNDRMICKINWKLSAEGRGGKGSGGRGGGKGRNEVRRVRERERRESTLRERLLTHFELEIGTIKATGEDLAARTGHAEDLHRVD